MSNSKVYAIFLILLSGVILSLAYSSSIYNVVISNTVQISANYVVNATSGSATDIQSAVNTVISHGGGTVYIPAGDWVVNQQPVGPYGNGGAISIDLETLPSGAWLNIIGSYTNTTVVQQNGQTFKNVPSCVLRSFTCVDNNLSTTYATFGIVGSNASSNNFNFVNSENRHVRISGITILGDVINDGTAVSNGNDGIDLFYVDGYLVDHCAIDSNTGEDINSMSSKGVVSNCTITQLYHAVWNEANAPSDSGVWGYGVGVYGNMGFYNNGLGNPTWIIDANLSAIRGQYNWQGLNLGYMCPVDGNLAVTYTTSISFTAGPVYVESNVFYECRHTVSSSQYAYYVERFNVAYGGVGLQMSDQHGGGYTLAANEYATRGTEIYNNTFYGITTNYGTGSYAMMLRGGAMLFFNNTCNGTPTGVELGNENYQSSDANDPEYCNNTWIWNNTFINVDSPLFVVPGVGIRAGVNYFCDSCGGTQAPTNPAPPLAGYTAYAYPNPVVTSP